MLDFSAQPSAWLLGPTLAIAFTLAASAQIALRLTYRTMQGRPAGLSGFAAARRMLDENGLGDVAIQQVPGTFSDHYEPARRVVRLSGRVYHGRSLAAVGVAAQQVGHALQHAAGDLRIHTVGLAGVAAGFGGGVGVMLLLLGIWLRPLHWLGGAIFSAAVLLQLVNLPSAWNAGRRGFEQLRALEILSATQLPACRPVIRAAALTYLAVTVQTPITAVAGLVRYLARHA